MTTAVQVQYRRGTASQVAAFTGAQGELVIDTTSNRVVVQDGSTAGGWPAAKLSEVVTSVASSGGGVISETGGAVTIGEPGGFLNKFRNGTMDVWQRGTSALTATTAGTYTADGWIVLPTGVSVTAAQAGGRLTTKCSLQVTGAASVTDVIVKQRIESYVAAPLCSQIVTVQAQVYNNCGASITPKLTVNHAGSQDVWTSPVADVNAVNLQACANGQWTQVAYTFSASASSYNGLEVVFDFGNNFGSSSNSIQITECDIRVTPSVPSGLNSSPSPPELRPVPLELALCQRYFSTPFGNGVTPADNTASLRWMGVANSTTNIGANRLQFPSAMRATPTIVFYRSTVGGTNGQWTWFNAGGQVDGTGTTASAITTTGFTVNVVIAGATVGQAYQIQGLWAASAEL